ncbi:UNVERIFIED_CONTAM: hypothetical protein FKN15_072195 [Acipenser sinensis]
MEMFNDLLPCSQKTALLFHLSYLCMANFPELERKLRAKATESQQLFSSSAILLLQCASTGDNIVKMLFPMIRTAVEKKNAVLAVKILEKAKSWIQDTCNKVDETVKKYERLDKDVGDTCSDVNKTKVEKEKEKGEKTTEAKALESRVNALEVKLESLKEESEEVEKSIKEENKKLEEMVNGIAERDRKFAIAAAAVPIIGLVVYGFQKLINDPKDQAAMSVSKSRLEELNKQRKSLSSQSWKHEMELITLQMEYSKAQIKIGSVGDPSQLKDVQKCLTRIQQILNKMKQFWETTGVALENLKQKTFAGEDMIEFLGDCQGLFLQSLDVAENLQCSEVVLDEKLKTEATAIGVHWDLPIVTVQNRYWYAQQLLVHAVVDRRQKAVQQVQKGLKECGILEMVQRQPTTVGLLFPPASEADIDREAGVTSENSVAQAR